MKKSKLLELLESFDGHDYSRMQKFLDSPFFHADQELRQLFSIYHSSFLKGERTSEDKFAMYEKVFVNQAFDDQRWRYLVSDLCKKIEEFITYKYLERQEAQWLSLKQEAMLQRDCRKSFYANGIELKKFLDKGWKEDESHLWKHRMNMRNLVFETRHGSRKVLPDFAVTMAELDNFYLARKLRIAAEMINAQNVLSGQADIKLLDEVRLLAGNAEFDQVVAVQVYKQVLNTLQSPDREEYFFELKQLVEEHGSEFPPKERQELFHYLKNYCIKRLNTGATHFLEILFDIYQLQLKDPRVFKGDPLSPWEYKNVVTIGLRLKKNEWVEEFIRKYNRYLEPEMQNNAFVYNMANWNFHQGNYRETLRLFQEVEFTDLYYQLDVRAILLKVYFETAEDESLHYHASAFRNFLSRNRALSPYQKKIYRNLLRYTLQLNRMKLQKERLSGLLKEIREVKQIADLRWLEQKVLEFVELPEA